MFLFPGQREGENILAIIHKHPIVYVKILLAFLVVTILPIFFFSFFWFSAYPLNSFYQRGLIVGIFLCLYFLYGLLFSCITLINEEFDVFIITTDRLIDITQVTFLKRTVTTTPLEQIQDTTGSIHGLIPTILHYGDLTVQTAAGTASDFFIDRIPDPEGVARNILDWANKKRDEDKIAPPVKNEN